MNPKELPPIQKPKANGPNLNKKDKLGAIRKSTSPNWKDGLQLKPDIGSVTAGSLFNSELVFCMKTFLSLGSTNVAPRKLRFTINQFLSCLQRFESRVDPSVFAKNLLLCGETLLDLPGFHLLAKQQCFERALAVNELNLQIPKAAEATELSLNMSPETFSPRIQVGIATADFLTLLSRDFALANPESIDEIVKILSTFSSLVLKEQNPTPNPSIVFNCVYNTLTIVELIQKSSKYKVSGHLDWILPFLGNGLNEFTTFNVCIKLHRIFSLEEQLVLVEANLRLSIEFFKKRLEKTGDIGSYSAKAVRFLSALYCGTIVRHPTAAMVPDLQNVYLNLPCALDDSIKMEMSWLELAKGYTLTERGLFGDSKLYNYHIDQYWDHDGKTMPCDAVVEFLKSTFKVKLDQPLFRVNAVEDAPPVVEVEPVKEAEAKDVKDTKDQSKSKKKVTKEESEEEKMKKTWTVELKVALEPFSPPECLTAIVQSLGNLMNHSETLKFSEKDSDFVEFMIKTLFNIGDQLLCDFSPVRVKEKRQHFEDDDSDAGNYEFTPHDLHCFGNFLFQKKQFSKLNIVSIHIQQLKTESYVTISNKIRISLASFLLELQTGRKVSFVLNVEDGKSTPTDIAMSKFDISDEVGAFLAYSCDAVAQGLTSKVMLENHHGILESASDIFWNFLEPFTRDIEAAKKRYVIPLDSPLLQLFQFLISGFSHLSKHSNDLNLFLTGIALCQKLALLLQSQQEYSLSSEVLSEGKRMMELMLNRVTGFCGNELTCLTADLSFHHDLSDFHAASISDINKRLSCINVDLLCQFYKSEISRLRQSELKEMEEMEREELMLRHTKSKLVRPFRCKEENVISSYCGQEPTRKALYFMAIVSTEEFSEEENRKYLAKAVACLNQAKEIELNNIKLTKASKKFPGELVHRTSTSFTLKLNAFPGWEYQLIGKIGYSYSDICGVGIYYPFSNSSSTLVTVHGIIPNETYSIKITHKNSSETKSYSNILMNGSKPLNLPLCWTYLIGIAEQAGLYDVFYSAKDVLEKHFEINRLPAEKLWLTGPFQMYNSEELKPYSFNRDLVANSDPSVIRGFIQCICSMNEKTIIDFNQSSKSKDLINTQLLRLRNSLNYLLASDFANLVGEMKSELLCTIKAYEELKPFMKNGFNLPILVNLIITCHEKVLKTNAEFGNDRTKGIRHFLVPMAYYLIEVLIGLGETTLVGKIAYETMSTITLAAYSADTKILNSNAVESNLLGFLYKPFKGKGKNAIAIYLQEYGFHARLALTKPIKFGLTVNLKPFDYFYEKVETLLAQNKIAIPSSSTDPKKGGSFTAKKALDNFTTLKDILLLFAAGGYDLTIAEVSKFKKNPRYVEIMTHLISLSIEKDYLENAIKFSNELEEYIDKRAQTIIRNDELLNDLAHMKKDISIKRRRRAIFGQSTIYVSKTKARPVTGGERGSKFERATTALGRLSETGEALDFHFSTTDLKAEHFVAGASRPLTGKDFTKINEEGGKRGNLLSAGPAMQKGERTSSAVPQKHANDSNHGRAVSGTPRSQGLSITNREKFLKPAATGSAVQSTADVSSSGTESFSSGSHSSKDKDRGRASSAGNSENAELSAKDKKKRHMFRHNLMHGKSPAEREKIDSSLKLLDTKFVELWRRRRYLRRLRAIGQVENSWRSRGMALRANALFGQIQKEVRNQAGFLTSHQERFEFRLSGGIFPNLYFKTDSATVSVELYPALNSTFVDMMQSFVQSVVLAERCNNYMQVFQYAKEFWNAIRYCLDAGKFNHEFWKRYLWKGLESVAIAILSTLEQIRINLQFYGNNFLHYPFGFLRDGGYIFTSLHELYHQSYIGEWIDEYSGFHRLEVDLAFCSDFILYTIEWLFISNKINRISLLQEYLQAVFGNIHAHLIDPLLIGIEHVQTPKNISNLSMAQLWSTCRYLSAQIAWKKTNDVVDDFAVVNEMIATCFGRYEILMNHPKEEDLNAFVALEIAEFLFDNGRHDGAAVYWSKSLDYLFKTTKMAHNWRTVLSFDIVDSFTTKKAFKLISAVGGLRNAMLAATIFTKIAKNVYTCHLNKNYEFCWLASHFIFAGLWTAPDFPNEYLGYVDFTVGKFGEDFFKDQYVLTSLDLAETLAYLSRVVIDKDSAHLSLPLLSLLEFIAQSYLNSYQLVSTAKILKVEALMKLNFVNEAISNLVAIYKKTQTKKRDEIPIEINFDNNATVMNLQHYVQLKNFLYIQMGDKAKIYFTTSFIYEIELAKISLIVKILGEADKSLSVLFTYQKENENDPPKLQTQQKALLDQCKQILLKHINQLQQIIKSKTLPITLVESEKAGVFQIALIYARLIQAARIFVDVCFYLKDHGQAIKWGFIVQSKLNQLKAGNTVEQYLEETVVSQLGSHFFFHITEKFLICMLSNEKNTNNMPVAKKSLGECLSMKCAWMKFKSIMLVAEIFMEEPNSITKAEFEDYMAQLQEIVNILSIKSMQEALLPKYIALMKSLKQKSLLNGISADLKELEPPKSALFIDPMFLFGRDIPYDSFSGDVVEQKLRSDLEELYNRVKTEIPIQCPLYAEHVILIGIQLFKDRTKWELRSKKFHCYSEFAQKFLALYLDISKANDSYIPRLAMLAYSIMFKIEYETNNFSKGWEYLYLSAYISLVHLKEKNGQASFVHSVIPEEISIELISWMERLPLDEYKKYDILDMDERHLLSSAQLTVNPLDLVAYKHSLEEFVCRLPEMWLTKSMTAYYRLKKLNSFLKVIEPDDYKYRSIEDMPGRQEGNFMITGWLRDSLIKRENDLSMASIHLIERALTSFVPPDRSPNSNNKNKQYKVLVVCICKANKIEYFIRNIPDRIVTYFVTAIKSTLVSLGYYQTTKESTFLAEAQEQWMTIVQAIQVLVGSKEKNRPTLSIRNALILLEIFESLNFLGFGHGFSPLSLPTRNPFIINTDVKIATNEYDGDSNGDEVLLSIFQ